MVYNLSNDLFQLHIVVYIILACHWVVKNYDSGEDAGLNCFNLVQVVPTSSIQVVPTSLIQVVPTSLIQVVPTSLIQVVPTSLIQVVPTSLIQVVPTSLIQVVSTSLIQGLPTNLIQVVPTSFVIQIVNFANLFQLAQQSVANLHTSSRCNKVWLSMIRLATTSLV